MTKDIIISYTALDCKPSCTWDDISNVILGFIKLLSLSSLLCSCPVIVLFVMFAFRFVCSFWLLLAAWLYVNILFRLFTFAVVIVLFVMFAFCFVRSFWLLLASWLYVNILFRLFTLAVVL